MARYTDIYYYYYGKNKETMCNIVILCIHKFEYSFYLYTYKSLINEK